MERGEERFFGDLPLRNDNVLLWIFCITFRMTTEDSCPYAKGGLVYGPYRDVAMMSRTIFHTGDEAPCGREVQTSIATK